MNKDKKKKLSNKYAGALVPHDIGIHYPLMVILAITFIVYLPALANSFLLWDDHSYTWENPYLKNFDFAKVFSFSTYYLGHYHPLTMLWFHLEYLLFPKGEPGICGGLNPFWFHLNNIILHLLNTSLVFFAIYELKNKKEWVTAAVTALLFGIHPMHVESVAWIAELKDVLYSLFFLGSLLVYIRYLASGRFTLLAVSFILFIFSDLSKEQAITLPALLFVIDYYRGRKFSLKTVLEKVPFLVLSALFGVLAIKASVAVSAVNSQASLLLNGLNGCYSFLSYIFMMFIPANLCAIHPYTWIRISGLPFWFYLLPLVLAGFFALAAIPAKKSKEYLFGLLFYTVTVSVVLKFVPVGDSLINERYTYIPFIGLFFIAGHLFRVYGMKPGWKYPSYLILAVAVTLLCFTSGQRIRTWKDNYTFWNDVVSKYPGHWRGYYGLSVLYYNAGDFGKAFENANLACGLNPPAAPYAMRGTLYFDKLGNYDKAITDFNKVLSFKEKDSPFNTPAQINLGAAWFHKGNFAKADTEYTKAILMDPASATAYVKRGTLYADNLGLFDRALDDFHNALLVDPANKEAALGIGYCFYRKNMSAQAIHAFDKAIEMDNSDGRLYYFKALALAGAGRFKEAWQVGIKSKELGFNISESELGGWKNQAGK